MKVSTPNCSVLNSNQSDTDGPKFLTFINFGQKLSLYDRLNFAHNEPTELNEVNLKVDYMPFPFRNLTGLLQEKKN
jgi:hypothetical protein